MKLLPSFLILMSGILLCCGTSCHKTEWTKQEVVDWDAKYHFLRGGLGYRGSDQEYHYFIARAIDEWVYIQIRKDDLTLTDERPYSLASNAPLAYYAVDPGRNFQKIEQTGESGTPLSGVKTKK